MKNAKILMINFTLRWKTCYSIALIARNLTNYTVNPKLKDNCSNDIWTMFIVFKVINGTICSEKLTFFKENWKTQWRE